jgi:hypothetical protein
MLVRRTVPTFTHSLACALILLAVGCSPQRTAEVVDMGMVTHPDAATEKPPMLDGRLSAVAGPGPNAVTLNWQAAENPDGVEYLVHWSTTELFDQQENARTSATTFVANKLEAARTYYFIVRAQNAAGTTNGPQTSAQTLDGNDTTPPMFLGVDRSREPLLSSSTTVTLSWAAASDEYTPSSLMQYLIYAARDPGGQDFTAPTYYSALGALTFDARGLDSDSTYYFVVRAEDRAGNQDANTVEVQAATKSISFAQDVMPIFDANCAACHPGSGIDWFAPHDPLATRERLLDSMASDCAALLVVPLDLTASALYRKLNGTECGGVMPPTAPLAAYEIKTVAQWIQAGAPAN